VTEQGKLCYKKIYEKRIYKTIYKTIGRPKKSATFKVRAIIVLLG